MAEPRMMVNRLELVIPPRIWERLVRIERKAGIRKEDLVMRALVRVIEEFEE